MTDPEVMGGIVIGGLTRGLLAAKYDNPKPIPSFHYEMWDLCGSDKKKVAIAAPRGHAKSTAITHAFILAMMLFREKAFCLLVSDTEGQAVEFLGDIKAELTGNEALRQTFDVKKIIKDTETNVICQFKDGEMFRIQAKGSEQKVRGLKWRGKRPDLIVGDDLENDEIVMNPDRREKFRRWLMNALIPCGSDTCLIRLVGTILHADSALQRLIEDPTWDHLFYEAHNPDFSEILWPEQFSQERLLAIRAGYEAQNDLSGYAQEYLNKPMAVESAFFNPDYFFDFERDDSGEWLRSNLEYFAAADFAISEKERADYTAIVVCGIDPKGMVHVVDAKRGRWDAEQIISELLATQKMWNPNVFTFETAKIDKAIGPFLNSAMIERRIYLNIVKMTPTQSKTMRARSIQAMHKAGMLRYDKKASWYPDFESELLTISESGPRGKHDDFFDAFAYVGLTIDQYFEAQSDEELEDEEYEEMYESYHDMGRCASTGY
jgi:predicted phage terminase large subunit-like protein